MGNRGDPRGSPKAEMHPDALSWEPLDFGSVAGCSAAHRSLLGVRGEMGTVTGANARSVFAQQGPRRALTRGCQARAVCRTGRGGALQAAPWPPLSSHSKGTEPAHLLRSGDTDAIPPRQARGPSVPEGAASSTEQDLFYCHHDSPSLAYQEPLAWGGGGGRWLYRPVRRST